MLGLPRKREAAPWERRRWPLLMLSVVLAVFLAAGLILRMYSERSAWSLVSTAIGDYRRLPLPDGSTLELNTATEVRYRLSDAVQAGCAAGRWHGGARAEHGYG
jgi:ferric-dicitrate binding protein FerR (iron transport regulator)